MAEGVKSVPECSVFHLWRLLSKFLCLCFSNGSKVFKRPCFWKSAQISCKGQAAQSGFLALQTSRPKCTIRWQKSPDSSGGNTFRNEVPLYTDRFRLPAQAGLWSGCSEYLLLSRACEIHPLKSDLRSSVRFRKGRLVSSMVSGNWESKFTISWVHISLMLLALFLYNPQGLDNFFNVVNIRSSKIFQGSKPPEQVFCDNIDPCIGTLRWKAGRYQKFIRFS